MAKMTVLSMVQSILNDMDSDEVNSITDTVEAAQVASILEDVFYAITNDRKWPTHKKLSTLEATTSATPSHMRIPTTSDVTDIEWIKYDVQTATNTRKQFQTITYLEPEEFTLLLMGRDSTSTAIDTITNISDGVPLLIYNNAAPIHYTSFDDDYIVFDGYDSAIETNLQASKTMIYAVVEPTFTKSDLAVPDIPAKAFPYFLSEAKSKAFAVLKQSANAKEEQISRRQRSYLSRTKWRIGGGINYPNYARMPKK
jgi:hypothetical protein